MSIDTIRVRTESQAGGLKPESPPTPGVVDVSDLPTERIRTLADDAHPEVYLERRGGRTFLVAAQ